MSSPGSIRVLNLPPGVPGWWRELLRGWGGLMDRYCEDGEDAPYWYGERALTGLLAAAAWQRKAGWSLEEFTGRRRSGAGRGDAWIGVGADTYTIEAKAIYTYETPTPGQRPQLLSDS
jgi:hypothetical protein